MTTDSVADMDAGLTIAELRELATVIDRVPLSLDLAGAPTARQVARELSGQINDYLIPRLSRLDAPLLAVLGGSTGAGKSTITNALAGAPVARPGVLRPTTRRPVLACHPDDRRWFANEIDGAAAVLPELPRTAGGDVEADVTPGADGLRLVVTESLPPGLGLLDSPDIDSVEVANHDLAALLLGAADLWIFVTTAVRYADAVPWEYLARAAERSAAIAVVLNRVPPGAADELGSDLRRMLDEHALQSAHLFTIDEGALDAGVAPMRAWLDGLVSNSEQRQQVARQTLAGVAASLPGRAQVVAVAVEEQARELDDLADIAAARWRQAVDDVDSTLDHGIAMRDEILQRFSEQVGTSELMGKVQSTVGRWRDRVVNTVRGRPSASTEVRVEISDTVEQLIVRVADRAALGIVERWQSAPGGRQVLATAPPGLDRSDPQLVSLAQRMVTDWQDAMLAMIVDQAGPKLAVARTLSYGINGVGAALMIALFSQTGGLTGGEAVIAGGAAAASQTVLSAVFGDQAVRQLERDARADLLRRVGALFEGEQARYRRLLDTFGAPGAPDVIRRLANSVAEEIR